MATFDDTCRSGQGHIISTPDLARSSVDASLDEARRLLLEKGWTETRSERFVNPERFPGVWTEFSKGEDICRVTVIEGAQGTHVDYAVARRAGAR